MISVRLASLAIVSILVLSQAMFVVQAENPSQGDGYSLGSWSAPPNLLESLWSAYMLPWNDSTPTATDMSHLLDPPAGKHGFLEVHDDGHFYFEDGTRGRFWGTNLCWGYCFPNYTQAEVIASRLAKFGFNLVRFHKFDSCYDYRFNIFLNHMDNTREVDWAKIDRMDYLVYQLKIRGIYVDINLHYERKFTANDGVAFADRMPCGNPWVTLFNETMIDLQKEFATIVLNHTNPYTGLKYVDDPAMAMVDVVNENSMFHGFLSDDLNGPVLGGGEWHEHLDIPPYYSKELNLKWNAYLRATYPDRAQLESNWKVGEIPLGSQNMIINSNFETNISHWDLDVGSGGSATKQWSNDNPAVPPGLAVINVTNPHFTWYGGLRFKQTGVGFTDNTWYTVSFWAMSSFGRKISMTILDSGGFGQNAREFYVAPVWQFYFWTFKKSGNGGGIGFDLAHDTSEHKGSANLYFFDEVKIFSGGVLGLQSFEDPWNDNVVRMTYPNRDSYTDNRFTDLVRFYSHIEMNFSRIMKDYLTKLGVRVPMDMTNGYYGFASMIGQLNMDYMDTHDYWEPLYLGYGDWMKPMFASTRAGTVPWIALSSFVSKPVSISEYNHFFPQPAHFECSLMVAGYARLQDWDAVMLFDYHGIDPLDIEYLPLGDGLDIDRNVAVMSQAPAAANIFLRGDASPALQTIILNYTTQEALEHLKTYGMTETFEPRTFNVTQTLIHKIRRNLVDGNIMSIDYGGATYPFVSDNGEITSAPLDGYFLLNTPRTQSMIGYLSNHTVSLPNLREEILNDITSLTLTSLTRFSIESSTHLLLTAVSEVRNTGMILSQGTPPSQMNATSWGTAPLVTQIVRGNVTVVLDNIDLPTHVYALTSTGERLREIPCTISINALGQLEIRFEVGDEVTTWYEIVRGTIPTARTIPSEPVTVAPGQSIELSGFGEYEGSTNQTPILAYRWGLSATSRPAETYVTFAYTQNTSLQLAKEGIYTVYFKVKALNDVWSDPVFLQIRVESSDVVPYIVVLAGIAVATVTTSIYIAVRRSRSKRASRSRGSNGSGNQVPCWTPFLGMLL